MNCTFLVKTIEHPLMNATSNTTLDQPVDSTVIDYVTKCIFRTFYLLEY